MPQVETKLRVIHTSIRKSRKSAGKRNPHLYAARHVPSDMQLVVRNRIGRYLKTFTGQLRDNMIMKLSAS